MAERSCYYRFAVLFGQKVWHFVLSQRLILPSLFAVISVIQFGIGEWAKDSWRIAFPYILVIEIVWVVIVIRTAFDLKGELAKEADKFRSRILLPSGEPIKPRRPSTVPIVVAASVSIAVMVSVQNLALRAALKEYVAIVREAKQVPTHPLVKSTPRKALLPKQDKDMLTVRLTPHVLVLRQREVIQSRTVRRNSLYGLAAVIHVRNQSTHPRQIQKLEIIGEVDCTYQDYLGGFIREGHVDELREEFIRLQPYYRIHWTAYPIGDGRVEGDGHERFLKFRFLEPEGYGGRVYHGNREDYFGFRSQNELPKATVTSAHLQDIISFARLTDSEPKELIAPRLREEVLTGKVAFRVVSDSSSVSIDLTNVNPVEWTLKEQWEDANPADLFHGLYGSSFDMSRQEAATRNSH